MRSVPDPGFAGDLGDPDAALRTAAAQWAAGGAFAPVLAALCTARLLVPVVTMPTDPAAETAERGQGSGAQLAAVLLSGRDGRRALLAFTGLPSMQAWDARARPVPVRAAAAASAAVAERAEALLVDVAGPVRIVVERTDLDQLASGHQLVRLGDAYAWVAGS